MLRNRDIVDIETGEAFLNVTVTTERDKQNYKKILEFCDGFLVIGGDDYNPVMYGDTNDLGLSKEINDEMDKLDQDIILYAVEKEKPVLGICRGHQGFSAVFGKALYQDIESAGLNHPVTDKLHEVTKVTNIGVAKLLPDKFTTNTFHHQATKDLPKGFAVLFKNHDVVEAIEHTTLPLLGIQWHPERMETKESDIIFNYFKDMFK